MTGTGEMIERVSEALAQSFRETVARVSGDSWEATGVTLPSKEVFDRYARAAIEAMREPTEAMALAGIEADMESGFGATMAWQAMINKALE